MGQGNRWAGNGGKCCDSDASGFGLLDVLMSIQRLDLVNQGTGNFQGRVGEQ